MQRDRRGKGPRVALRERASGRASGCGEVMQSPRATRPSRPVRGSLKQAPAMLLWVQWCIMGQELQARLVLRVERSAVAQPPDACVA